MDENNDMGSGGPDANYAGNYDFLFYRDDVDNDNGGGEPFLQTYTRDYLPFDRPVTPGNFLQRQSVMVRLHELMNAPFSALISGPYVVKCSVLALKTGPFYAHVDTPYS